MNNNATSEQSEAYIALGANLGQREQTLAEALERLNNQPGITVVRTSSVYETDPVGYLDQPTFLNMAAALRTTLSPVDLLRVLLSVETSLGRVRNIPNGPRTVDLDLLWMEGRTLEAPELSLPHPRMAERAFVLVPLNEIVPEDETSGLRKLVTSALQTLDGKDGIRLWTSSVWAGGSGHSAN